MSPVGFEPTIAAGERPKSYALDRVATGIGRTQTLENYILIIKSNESAFVSLLLFKKKIILTFINNYG